MNNPLIEVKHLTFKRGERTIYDNLNLRVEKGKLRPLWAPPGLAKQPC